MEVKSMEFSIISHLVQKQNFVRLIEAVIRDIFHPSNLHATGRGLTYSHLVKPRRQVNIRAHGLDN